MRRCTINVSSLLVVSLLVAKSDVVILLGRRSSLPSCTVCIAGINVSCIIWEDENQEGSMGTSLSSSRLN